MIMKKNNLPFLEINLKLQSIHWPDFTLKMILITSSKQVNFGRRKEDSESLKGKRTVEV